MSERHPLVIIGAGPAGMAAAASAARHGIRPVLLDEQPAPGGQIYRGVDQAPRTRGELLGTDYRHGRTLTEPLRHADVDYRPGSMVWQLTRDREVGVLRQGRAALIQAERVIIATGAQERPFPVPGWTLPGAMGAGAGQVLLKTSGLVPEGPVVIAGTGPLLFLVAVQYLRSGANVAAVLETTAPRHRWAALRHLPGALRGYGHLRKGLALLAELRRHGVRHVRGVDALRIEGENRVAAVAWRRAGRWERVAATTALLHHGVVPNVQMTRALGCEHVWDARQRSWRPRLDEHLTTDAPGIAVAGDGGGIVGARASEHQGRIAAFAAAHAMGAMDRGVRDAELAPVRRALTRELAVRAFLDVRYRPAEHWLRPDDEVTVCRCEEVSAGEIRRVAALGCSGPNQAKSFSRCGMGPCQGRMCGLTVAELLAEANAESVAAVGYYRIRPPLKPITLAQLAAAATADDEAA
ncbi:NAD(P)/FAD-dependent oxidoreductase [Arhodomonas sp. AD133]|uniref:FAD/NAD(P)-dependent oxidoreductase n=1 Tax=Arhodomonas sp. AD133 TaxID=3415009 RepID=UPI003EB71346